MNEDILSIYLEEFKNGNMTHFHTFYELTKKGVFYNILSLTKSYELSEDLLQDTYVKFLSSVKEIKTSKSVLGYLIMISKNTTLDYFKKKKEEQFEEYEEVESKDTYSLDKLILLEKMRDILKEKEFNLILYHLIDELTFEEISLITKEPLGTLLFRYNTAIKKIRRELKYEEI